MGESRGSAILVVDDEPQVRSLVRLILQPLGYEILLCANGREALDRFEHRRSEIALVVTDVMMPGMNGLELAEKIRRIDPEMRILFMSGYSAEFRAILENLPHLAKPFANRELLEKTRALLNS